MTNDELSSIVMKLLENAAKSTENIGKIVVLIQNLAEGLAELTGRYEMLLAEVRKEEPREWADREDAA